MAVFDLRRRLGALQLKSRSRKSMATLWRRSHYGNQKQAWPKQEAFFCLIDLIDCFRVFLAVVSIDLEYFNTLNCLWFYLCRASNVTTFCLHDCIN